MSWRGNHIRLGGEKENRKTDGEKMGATTAGLPDFITRPNRKDRKAKKRAAKQRAEQIKVTGKDRFLERVVEQNITSTIGLDSEEREKLIKLQRATGVTEERRQKLNMAEGMRIGYGERYLPRAQNVCQVPIEYYHKRGWLSDRQFDAGSKFYEMWYFGAMKIGMAQMKLSCVRGGFADPQFLKVMADKYQRAKRAIRGLPQALVCYNVCCLGEWASKLWPRKIAFEEGAEITAEDLRPFYKDRDQKMEWLKQGLGDLALHFRMPEKKEFPQSKENA